MTTMATLTKMTKTDEIKASQILVDNTFVADDKTRLRQAPGLHLFAPVNIYHMQDTTKHGDKKHTLKDKCQNIQ